MKWILSCMIFMLAIFSGCTGCEEVANGKPQTGDGGTIQLRSELQKRVSQDNAFSLDLLKKTITETNKTNVFISPLSVSMCLGMVWNGAAGTTRTEMEKALQMEGMTVDEINQYYQILIDSLPQADSKTKLSLANSIWYKKNFSVKQSFLDVNKNYFKAEIQPLDFASPSAVTTINNWCDSKTNHLISSIIDEIPENAVMYLINALYFKGIWTIQFDPKETRLANFTTEAGTAVPVNMMNKAMKVLYRYDPYAQYVDLPYGNGTFSMTLILPNQGKTTSQVLDYLTPSQLNTVLAHLDSAFVEIGLPRFKEECKFELNDELIAMGMPQAFTDQADFSNISDWEILISKVLHKTYIEVTEEGTKAAAVTSTEIVATSIPPQVTVNKPFLFLIREKGTGVILFAGKMGAVSKY
ncbi:MAG: serpin family protein [Bacteroidota bacterium]|nr:serpin family protein [Bacteroidota bacterium]